jgi:uncharacterized protein YdeI (BOF family)
MMKALILTLAALLLYPVSAWAVIDDDDVLVTPQGSVIIDENSDTVVSGIISDVSGDNFTMLNGTQEIQVSTDDMDMENAGDLLVAGMNVTIQGKFDDGELQARRIIQHPQ